MSVLSVAVRRAAHKLVPTQLPAYVVASFGRSGSTMLQATMASGLAFARFGSRHRFFRKACASTAWNLDHALLEPGITYKTHDYPAGLRGRKRVRALFIFGSAVDAARSAYVLGRGDSRWMRGHASNLKRSGVRAEDLLQGDALGFLDQARAWSRFREVPTLCVRFESLWDQVEALRDFTGLPLHLPARRERTSKVVPNDVERKLKSEFGPIDEELARLPAITILP